MGGGGGEYWVFGLELDGDGWLVGWLVWEDWEVVMGDFLIGGWLVG